MCLREAPEPQAQDIQPGKVQVPLCMCAAAALCGVLMLLASRRASLGFLQRSPPALYMSTAANEYGPPLIKAFWCRIGCRTMRMAYGPSDVCHGCPFSPLSFFPSCIKIGGVLLCTPSLPCYNSLSIELALYCMHDVLNCWPNAHFFSATAAYWMTSEACTLMSVCVTVCPDSCLTPKLPVQRHCDIRPD